MRVLYDHQIFSRQNFGGISRYFSELMKSYSETRLIDFQLSLKYSNNIYTYKAGFCDPTRFFPGIGIGVVRRIRKWLWEKNKLWSVNAIRSGNFDVFHPTYYDDYFLDILGKKPFVVTIHDLIDELFHVQGPVEEDQLRGVRDLAHRSCAIIAVSEHTKNDIVRFYGIEAERVTVVHHGAPHLSRVTSRGTRPDHLPKSYLLFVGKRGGYKNFETCLRALAPILDRQAGPALVCAGGGRFRGHEQDLLETLGVREAVHQWDVDDAVLGALYQNARAFVFPSRYEGFGIPILEAFAESCPVVLSNASCFPEIAGDAAVYFDPTSEEDIRTSVLRVLADPALAAECVERGKERLRLFRWEETARRTAEVYRRVFAESQEGRHGSGRGSASEASPAGGEGSPAGGLV